MRGGWLPKPSANLLCKHDNDALWAAEVAKPVHVLVVLHPTKEFRAAGLQPGDDGVDVIDCERDAADTESVSAARSGRRPGPVGR